MHPLGRKWLARLLGEEGERAAARYLKKKGHRILARNLVLHSGEIDILSRDGDSLVFVEVKTRRHGTPAEAVTEAKQRSLTLAALEFLKKNRSLEVRSRFDVVAIVWPEGQSHPDIEHIENAFEPIGKRQMFR